MSNSQKEVLNSLHKQFSGEAARKAGLKPTIINIFDNSYRSTAAGLRDLSNELSATCIEVIDLDHGLSEMHADQYHKVLWDLAEEIRKIADRLENDLSEKW